ncbi:hypothetical protein [Pontibacter amylolyticus]|uniref:Capsule polysaccharide biosynthesis protein n=1 Tax=Pontibacter amylolyticus TaxID=1424080 RepID=A0ABQ1WD38_9BACT|nr:hypothetical protein [Pontibacter amylolyticus]GGG25371.1 hypothetical protein GCM10011323_31400 [Pontibacter amylolyticus]
MRVLYALSHLEDWVGFALEMKQHHGWDPQYWLSTSATDHLIGHHFPTCRRHSYTDIIRGKSPYGIDLFQPSSIDQKTIREYAFEMDQAMKMMDRLDSGDAFSYNERKSFLIKMLNYAHNVYFTFRPELAVFTEVPHHAAQYILYVVLKRYGVKTLMFKPIFVGELRLLIYGDIYDNPFDTLNAFSLNTGPSESELASIKQYIAKLRGDYGAGIPEYMMKQQKTSGYVSTIYKTFFHLLRQGSVKNLLDRAKTTNVLKLKDKRLEESLPSRADLYWIKLKGLKKKRELRHEYRKLSIERPNLDVPFVFFPLHYQPERTTSPDGGVYVDQFLAISLLRKILPNEVKIYVKEHTSQFHPKMDGHLGRSVYQYYEIKELYNVELISDSLQSFELIDKSICVATVTGTIGIEAVARKKAALIFGPGCWYRSLKGTFFIDDEESLKVATKKIFEGMVIEEQDLLDFLIKLHTITFKGKLTPGSNSINSERNISALVKSVELYVARVFQNDFSEDHAL